MTNDRRGPRPRGETPGARRPSDTASAIDDAVAAAADEVQRRLGLEGVPEAVVTPRDVLRSRYPRDTISDDAVTEDEAVTEEMQPFAHGAHGPHAAPASSHRATATPGSSLSPLAMAPRASVAPAPITPRLGPHARRAASSSLGRGDPMRAATARSPRGPWILLLGVLGGVAAFATVMALRPTGAASSPDAEAPRRAAAEPLPRADAGAKAASVDGGMDHGLDGGVDGGVTGARARKRGSSSR